jgi:hypothetical protein
MVVAVGVAVTVTVVGTCIVVVVGFGGGGAPPGKATARRGSIKREKKHLNCIVSGR